MLVDVLCRGFRMHGYISCGYIEDRGYWFHNSVCRLDTDVILYSSLECTLGFGHIYFRICFIFIRVFNCVKCFAIRPVDCDTLCQTLKWKITKAGNEIFCCILLNRRLSLAIKMLLYIVLSMKLFNDVKTRFRYFCQLCNNILLFTAVRLFVAFHTR